MKETIDQKILSEFSKDALDFYDELIWLYHSQNPEKWQHRDNALFRKRISEKYAKIAADYNTLEENGIIDKIDYSDFRNSLKIYTEANKKLVNDIIDKSK